MDQVVDNIEEYTQARAHTTGDLITALEIPTDELALHVNEKGEITREVVKRRLEGKNPDTPDIWLKTLYNIDDLDNDILQQIKENDGELAVAIMVYHKLGKLKKKARAEALVYSD
jgi:plasmid maintenance system antidote protein VapI